MQKFINRSIYPLLKNSLKEKYISVILGPRQVGKTTLIKKLINDCKKQGIAEKNVLLLNFDDPELRMEISQKPKAFLQKIEFAFGEPISEFSSKKYLFLDEAQKKPEIFDLLKMLYDEHQEKIKIIITGSSSLNLLKKSAETLAGRVRFYNLSSLSWREIISKSISISDYSFIEGIAKGEINYKTLLAMRADVFKEKEKIIFHWNNYLIRGGMPEIFLMESQEKRSEAFRDYIKTYLERDIKGLKQVGDENLFLETLNIVLLRDAQILNSASLASEIGIQRLTLKKYFSILKETFLINTLRPFIKQSKQSAKSPKIYFFDYGITNYVRKIYSLGQLNVSERLGSVFENIIVNNLFKYFSNNPEPPNINFWRDYQGHEIDLIISDNKNIIPVEITCSDKINRQKINNLKAFYKTFPSANNGFIIWQGGLEQIKLDNKIIFAIPYWMWL